MQRFIGIIMFLFVNLPAITFAGSTQNQVDSILRCTSPLWRQIKLVEVIAKIPESYKTRYEEIASAPGDSFQKWETHKFSSRSKVLLTMVAHFKNGTSTVSESYYPYEFELPLNLTADNNRTFSFGNDSERVSITYHSKYGWLSPRWGLTESEITAQRISCSDVVESK